MQCVRCGTPLVRGAEFVRVAVMVGPAPGPLRWARDGPWPYLELCLRCSRRIGLELATPPLHVGDFPAPAAGPPVAVEVLEPVPTTAEPPGVAGDRVCTSTDSPATPGPASPRPRVNRPGRFARQWSQDTPADGT